MILIPDQSINSPRVSTVLPQKRARPQPDLLSPRTIRQGTLVRSPLARADFIASSQPVSSFLQQFFAVPFYISRFIPFPKPYLKSTVDAFYVTDLDFY